MPSIFILLFSGQIILRICENCFTSLNEKELIGGPRICSVRDANSILLSKKRVYWRLLFIAYFARPSLANRYCAVLMPRGLDISQTIQALEELKILSYFLIEGISVSDFCY